MNEQKGETLTLMIRGEPRTYARDKAGKRQAIVDGLNAIERVMVGETAYLPSTDCLQVVAAVLYPEGIETADAYRLVCEVTDKACAHLGFGAEVTLEPPQVPFAQRGAYRPQLPPVAVEMVLAKMGQAGLSSDYPRREISQAMVWQQVGEAVYGRSWKELTAVEQSQIAEQVTEMVAQAGWQSEQSGHQALYIQPLPVNEAAARAELMQMIAEGNGRPLMVNRVHSRIQEGAYGRSYYTRELDAVLQAIVESILPAQGYCPTPEGGEYRPAAAELQLEAVAEIAARLATLEPIPTELGPVLLVQDVAATLCERTVSDWQAEQVASDERVVQALRQVGYQAEPTWCQAYHFQPKRAGYEAQAVFVREVRVRRDLNKTLALAKGLGVYTPALTIDDGDETLVYLEMMGAKQAVKANWAALAGGGKVHWLGRKRIRLDGMKEHVKIQATLPCGWANQILIHKQASLKEMNPERPFYLLDDGTQPIPPLFYAMLNKALALPLLPEWAGHLWENGRLRSLIALLDNGDGQGHAAWRVLPAPDEWQSVVADGLAGGQIQF
jgi:hypothetical protein